MRICHPRIIGIKDVSA